MTQSSRDGSSRTRSIILFLVVALTAGAVAAMGGLPGKDKGVSGPPEDNRLAIAVHRVNRDYLAAENPRSLTLNFYCGTSKCGDKDSASLTIRPDDTSNKRNWKSAYKKEGFIIAVVENNDPVAYTPWNLKPNDKVYLWVGPLASKDTFPALYRIGEGISKPELVYTFTETAFCNVEPKPAQVHDVPFSDCRPVRGGDGLWISCSGGCCHVRSPSRLASQIQTEVSQP